jgi:hypothetical protein
MKRSIGKYCVVMAYGKHPISCHKKLRLAKKKAARVGGMVFENLECKANRGKNCGMRY